LPRLFLRRIPHRRLIAVVASGAKQSSAIGTATHSSVDCFVAYAPRNDWLSPTVDFVLFHVELRIDFYDDVLFEALF
jgi:hypothetical protein